MAKSKTVVVPVFDRVAVEMADPESKSKGGIVIPETARERPQRGVVVAVGPGRFSDSGQRIAMDVGVGDVVFYANAYVGQLVEHDGKQYRILMEAEILARIPRSEL